MSLLESLPIIRGFSLRPALCKLAPPYREPGAIGAPIIVLVHGTWSSSRSWSERRKELLTAISKEIPAAGIYFFDWFGVNGIRHRLVAAEQLAHDLDVLQAKYPESKLFTISHSHGGNVVAWAATITRCTQAGALYFNAPFLHVIRPAKERLLWLRTFLWMLAVLGVVPFLTILGNRAAVHDWRPTMGELLSGFVFLALLLTSIWLPRFILTIRRALLNSIDRPRRIEREIVASVAGDEVNSALGTVYILRFLSPHLFLLLSIPFLLILLTSSARDRLWYGPMFSLLFFSGVFLFLLISMAAYGATQALISLDLPLTVSAGPIGCVELNTLEGLSDAGLQHLRGTEQVTDAVLRLLALGQVTSATIREK